MGGGGAGAAPVGDERGMKRKGKREACRRNTKPPARTKPVGPVCCEADGF